MERLQKIHRNLLRNTRVSIRRYLNSEIAWEKRLISITGARGAGKTTLLLQRIKEVHGLQDHALYVTLDDIYFETTRLVEFADTFVENGGTHLYLDEVHKYQYWSKDLKLIYDYYPKLKIVFTGSSALNIYKGDSDLSRRAVAYKLAGLSFREFLLFDKGIDIPVMSLDQLLHSESLNDLPDKIDVLSSFKEYLSYGYYPFYLDGKSTYGESLRNIVNLVLETDLPAVENITYQSIHKIRRLLSILTAMVPFTPNISRLAQDLGTSRDVLLKYFSWLERVRIIHTLVSASKGMGPLTKPDKIYLDNTNLCYTLGDGNPDLGNLRETFFMNQLSVKHKVNTPKYGDFIVDEKYVFEVGGPSKTHAQIKGVPQAYVAADGILYRKGRKVPLWYFGFRY